jgi:hypothetical protein
MRGGRREGETTDWKRKRVTNLAEDTAGCLKSGCRRATGGQQSRGSPAAAAAAGGVGERTRARRASGAAAGAAMSRRTAGGVAADASGRVAGWRAAAGDVAGADAAVDGCGSRSRRVAVGGGDGGCGRGGDLRAPRSARP